VHSAIRDQGIDRTTWPMDSASLRAGMITGHSSIQTTERYLGSEQEIAIAVNDSLGL
jgi:hypothetical protein